MHKFISFLLFLLLLSDSHAQQHKVVCIAFYNLENLFDPADDPLTDDSEFTPHGSNHYTKEVYEEKLGHMAEALSQLGIETTPHGAAVIGVCEIENRKVLEDLVAHPKLQDRNYQIIHYDSRDARGIDVALLYQPTYFHVESSESIPMPTYIDNETEEVTKDKDGKKTTLDSLVNDTSYSRDILVVRGKLDGEDYAFTVNHWPSRRGGERATAPLRNKAAALNKQVVDKHTKQGIKTIVMGDLNDDPVNDSVKKFLLAKTTSDDLTEMMMYNPMYDFYKRGVGTTAYQDAWSLFDQIILSSNAVHDDDGYRFYRAHVFNALFLTQKSGQYKGYPHRTFSGNTYIHGYSDHYPVYVLLVKKM